MCKGEAYRTLSGRGEFRESRQASSCPIRLSRIFQFAYGILVNRGCLPIPDYLIFLIILKSIRYIRRAKGFLKCGVITSLWTPELALIYQLETRTHGYCYSCQSNTLLIQH